MGKGILPVAFDPLPSLDYTRAHRVVLRFSFEMLGFLPTLDVSCLVIVPNCGLVINTKNNVFWWPCYLFA